MEVPLTVTDTQNIIGKFEIRQANVPGKIDRQFATHKLQKHRRYKRRERGKWLISKKSASG
jgi:hypothetical protein